MGQVKITVKSGTPHQKFSVAFKKQVVREYEQGGVTKDLLMEKYGIRGKSQVLLWCRKYGKFVYSTQNENGRPMKDPQKQRIKELERKLKAAEEKLRIYDKLIEVTNRELDVDIVKKIEAKLSESLRQKRR